MSDANESATSGGLSFERAEFENQQKETLSCGYCKKPLSVQYWQIAKRPACAECRGIVEREVEAGKSLNRFLGGLAYGAVAAIAGCLGWMLVSKIFKGQYAIAAIGVGYLVGKAIRKGTRGQGGTRYQVLAVFLSYSAIALASLPLVMELVRHSDAGSRASLPFMVALAYELPFLGGTDSILGLFIIAIGLYEAWKLTRALPLNVLGPFPIESPLSPELPAASDATH
jgi:hypothetical protein